MRSVPRHVQVVLFQDSENLITQHIAIYAAETCVEVTVYAYLKQSETHIDLDISLMMCTS